MNSFKIRDAAACESLIQFITSYNPRNLFVSPGQKYDTLFQYLRCDPSHLYDLCNNVQPLSDELLNGLKGLNRGEFPEYLRFKYKEFETFFSMDEFLNSVLEEIMPELPISANGVGWECPKCGNVYGPHVDKCSHCSEKVIGSINKMDAF